MGISSDAADAVRAFAVELERLRSDAGSPSFRKLAASIHYSRTTLAEAVAGRRLPSLEVTLALVAACGGDADAWTSRWREVSEARRRTSRSGLVQPPSAAWPEQPVEDGSDPEAAGCHHDAVSVHSRKLATADRIVVGQVELRYSPAHHAAWGRFSGFSVLDHIAERDAVTVTVGIWRERDDARQSFTVRYCFDFHWCDILRTGNDKVRAEASVHADGTLLAAGETDLLGLP